MTSATRRLLPPLAADLSARGLVHAVTHPALLTSSRLASPLTLYTGIDPTAASPHIGNLLPLTASLRFLLHGHRVLALIGGATGAIGDPSGRATERSALARATLQHNEQGITREVHRFFAHGLAHAQRHGYPVDDHAHSRVQVVNNKSWTENLSLIDFLDSVGRHARVGVMLARDSVSARMKSDQGISFTEFTYQLVQANDFAHLYRNHGCRLQIGGSDQWGNIVAGLDLIRRQSCAPPSAPPDDRQDDLDAYGLTLPLVTTATGEKFGKSAGNAVWLDPSLTSPFDFYQFWMRVADADVARYLALYTLLPLEDIAAVMRAHAERPEARGAQHVLAREMSDLVHSPTATARVRHMSEVLFAPDRGGVRRVVEAHGAQAIVDAFEGDPRLVKVPWAHIEGPDAAGVCVAEADTQFHSITATATCTAEAIKLAKKGGLYLNQDRVADAQVQKVTRADLLGGQVCVLRTGKSNYWIVQVV